VKIIIPAQKIYAQMEDALILLFLHARYAILLPSAMIIIFVQMILV
jgi:hypothetical protein